MWTHSIRPARQMRRLDPVVGRIAEIREMTMIWGRRTRNAAVLIGERGVGKTAIVSVLARRRRHRIRCATTALLPSTFEP